MSWLFLPICLFDAKETGVVTKSCTYKMLVKSFLLLAVFFAEIMAKGAYDLFI